MKTFCFSILFSCCFLCQAQLNFGLQQPQDPATLPQSRVPQKEIYKNMPSKSTPKTSVSAINEFDFSIDSQWYLIDGTSIKVSAESPITTVTDTKQWYRATVPGTVLTSLVNEGIYPDPYFGLNNLQIPDTLCRTDWWYRTEFTFPYEIPENDFLQLTFNGINYRAEVWLNQHFLGNINGAFTRGIFDITSVAHKNEKNILAVRIIPPANPGIPQEQSRIAGQGPNGGALCLDGPTFISSEGWDWMPGIRDRNIGIWQDVIISRHGAVTAENIQIIPDIPLPDTTRAELKIKLQLVNHTPQKQTAKIDVTIDNINLTGNYIIEPNEHKELALTAVEFPQLNIANPHLWWPNGYGEQNLYTAQVTTTDTHGIKSTKKIRFGIRELEYEFAINTPKDGIKIIKLNPLLAYANGTEIFDRLNRKAYDTEVQVPTLNCQLPYPGITLSTSESPYMVILVNGQKIFCKGGNWGMDDAMKRVDKERLRPYFELQKGQNFNMIRNWTGESTQESFYELCDEYGLLVFNDFWMSTEGFNLAPLDHTLFRKNVEETVLRYRNHPSIALWCPRNEGFAPTDLEASITQILAQHDGTRYYIGNSRWLNTTNSGPWDFLTDEQYFKIAKGFSSEVGTVSVPTYRSLQKMMDKEDEWPIGDVWCYHDWHNTKWPNFNLFEEYMDKNYGKSTHAKMFCDLSQIQNFDSYRAIFEGWNSRLWNNTSGILLWMSHPAWPSTVWQTYTWDYETTGAYYGCRKACEPLHIQYNPLSRQAEVINATGQDYKNITIKYNLYTLTGDLIISGNRNIDIQPNCAKGYFKIPHVDKTHELYLLRLVLQQGKKILSQNDYWLNSSNERSRRGLLQIPQAEIKILKRKQKGNRYEFEVQNSSDNLAFGIRFALKDQNSQQYILPAIFSDGYFTLLPNEKRTISINRKIKPHETILIEGINIAD